MYIPINSTHSRKLKHIMIETHKLKGNPLKIKIKILSQKTNTHNPKLKYIFLLL